jgi:apolipoprotein N-acyltransferase
LGRVCLRLRQPFVSILAVPALWVTGEYITSLLMPHGAWWSFGYSQAGVQPVIQIASLTGVWGISFLLFGVSAAAAAFFAPDITKTMRMRILVLFLQ